VLLSNITFFVIFAVLDVSVAVNSCLNRSFLHLYLQFYYRAEDIDIANLSVCLSVCPLRSGTR